MTIMPTTATCQTEPISPGHEYNRSLLGEMLSQPSSEDVSCAGIVDQNAITTTTTTTTGATTLDGERYAPMGPSESSEAPYLSFRDPLDFFTDFWESKPGLDAEEDFFVCSPDYSGPSMAYPSSLQVVNSSSSSIGNTSPSLSRYVQDTQPAGSLAFNITEFNQTKSEEETEVEVEAAVRNIPQNNINDDFMFLSPARKRTIQETLSKRSANSLGDELDSKVIPDTYNGVLVDHHQQQQPQPQQRRKCSIAIPEPPLLKIQDYTTDCQQSVYSTESVYGNSLGCPSYLSTSMSSTQTLSTSYDSTHEKRTNPSTPGTSVWRLNNGELINEIPTKRRRTETEKAVTARIRKGGGACYNCKKNHRACKIEHLGIQEPEKDSESKTASRDSSWRMSDAKLPPVSSLDGSSQLRLGRGPDGESSSSFQEGLNESGFSAGLHDDSGMMRQFSYTPDAPLLPLFAGETSYNVNPFQDVFDEFNPFEF